MSTILVPVLFSAAATTATVTATVTATTTGCTRHRIQRRRGVRGGHGKRPYGALFGRRQRGSRRRCITYLRFLGGAAVAVVRLTIQRYVLENGAHTRHGLTGGTASCLCVQRFWVFDVEDGFVEGEQGCVGVAFAELGALLVDGKVDEWGHGGEDVETVLEADLQLVGCGFVAQPL